MINQKEIFTLHPDTPLAFFSFFFFSFFLLLIIILIKMEMLIFMFDSLISNNKGNKKNCPARLPWC